MRDINRIDRICDKLKELGKCYPDERLGQFFTNHIFNDGTDPFYKEDCKESGMKSDYQTGEDKIDKQISRYKLWERVMNETDYRKDYDKGSKQYGKLAKSFNSSYLDPQSNNKQDRETIMERHNDLRPKGEDYIDDLKPIDYNHVGRKCGKTNMIRDKIIDEAEGNE